MEIEKINIELDNEELNDLVKKLNAVYLDQQNSLPKLCYGVYKIDCWFADHPDEVVFSKSNDYYNKKKLFKMLGFTSKQITRYISSYLKYMTIADNAPVFKDLYKDFTYSKLIELLPVDTVKLENLIVNGQITSLMTVKEIREYLKSLSEEPVEKDEENQVSAEEEKFYILKNDTMRKDFLENYKTWGVWFEEPRLKLKYYRCKFGDKVLVVINGICDYGSYTYGERYKEDYKFYYLTPSGELILDPTCVSQIIKDMSTVEDKKVYLF